MGTMLALKSAEVRTLGEVARSLPSARLRELTSYARELRREVEERWEELSSDSRKALEDLARSWEDRSLPRDLFGKVRAFWEGLKLSLALARGEITREDLGEFLHEVSLLSRRVMDRLEEEDPAFQEALRKALAEESLPLSKDELRALILDP
jgi:predicted phage gp36 major capsid-like protein